VALFPSPLLSFTDKESIEWFLFLSFNNIGSEFAYLGHKLLLLSRRNFELIECIGQMIDDNIKILVANA
jgi:hypothetical protein